MNNSNDCVLFIPHRQNETQNDDNGNCDPTPFDPDESFDDHLYEEENWNDADIGQELINFLLRTGKIKEKTPSAPIQNEALARRNDQINNDRYDELIAAFNVILEEILLQTNQRSSPKDPAQAQQDSSNTPNDQECAGKCNKNPSTDPMSRCLTPFEKELLQKIKTLTNLLNTAVKKRNNNEELYNNFNESPQRDRRQIHLNGRNSEIISRGRSSSIKKRQTEVEKGKLDNDQHSKNGEDVNNSDSKDTMAIENILNKENNYGLDVEKFIEFIEDKIDHQEKETEGRDENQNIGDATKSRQRCSISVDNGFSIPMRLVKKSNGKFYLVLDRQNLYRERKN